MPSDNPPRSSPKNPEDKPRKQPGYSPTAGYDFSVKVPDGDEKERLVCDTCGWVHYINPKIVVGSVILWQDKFLLARRAIEPAKGYWTLPAGFLEERETTEAGAKREAFEEAEAEIDIKALLAVYDVPHISQVQIMFLADLVSPDVAPGIESLEVGFFEYDELPWNELAFPSVIWALKQFESVRNKQGFIPFRNPDRDDERFKFRL